MQRRLAERVREADLDAKDRNKEQEELEELKHKIFSGEYENPTQEYEKAKKEHEKMYKPQILIDVNLENMQRKEREQERQKLNLDKRRAPYATYEIDDDDEPQNAAAPPTAALSNADRHKSVSMESMGGHDYEDDGGRCSPEDSRSRGSGSQYSRNGSESRDYMSSGHGMDAESDNSNLPPSKSMHESAASTPPMHAPVISMNLSANSKKKKIESTGVFNNDDDNDEGSNPKKRKLVPLGMSILLKININNSILNVHLF